MGCRLHHKVAVTYIAVMCLMSCSDLGDCIKGTGKIMLEERSIGFINGITVDDDINLLPEIRTEVSEGMLYLRNDNICKYSHSYQKEILVRAHIKNLEKLAFAGSAKITSGNKLSLNHLLMWLDGARGEINLEIDIEKLILEHVSGNGLTTLSGEVREGIIESEAQGLLYLKDLKINNLKMTSNSYNNAYIWVSDTIDITITNLGNVYYRGDPFIKSYIRTGQGRFIPME